MMRDLVRDVRGELAGLDKRIAGYTRRIRSLFQDTEACQRIGRIEGIGSITATALVAAVVRSEKSVDRPDAGAATSQRGRPRKQERQDRLVGPGGRGGIPAREGCRELNGLGSLKTKAIPGTLQQRGRDGERDRSHRFSNLMCGPVRRTPMSRGP